MIKTIAFQVSCELTQDKGPMVRRVTRTHDDKYDTYLETNSVLPIMNASTSSYIIGDYECVVSFRRIKKQEENA